MIEDKLLCWKCRGLVEYEIKVRKRVKETSDNRKAEYDEQYGQCSVCHSEITIPGLFDINEESFVEAVSQIFKNESNRRTN